MIQAFLVALGGAIGSVLRYYVGQWALRLMGPAFPWGTLAVNVVGCFVIGVFAELIARRFNASMELRLLLITGFLGGFTGPVTLASSGTITLNPVSTPGTATLRIVTTTRGTFTVTVTGTSGTIQHQATATLTVR